MNLSSDSKWTVDADTVAGSAAGTSGADASLLNSNQGMQIVDNNTLYIADTGNHRVVVIQPGSTNATFIYGSGPGGADNELNAPGDVFVTSAFVYILDSFNYRVQRWSRNGSNVITVAGINGTPGDSSSMSTFGVSFGIFVDKYGYLYVSDQSNPRVLRYPPDSISGTNGTMVAGTGTRGSAPSELDGPGELFVDDDRTMYIADIYNYRIQKWTYGASSGVTMAGFDPLGAAVSQLYIPTAVIVDSNQYMYINDQGNHRIQRWAPGSCAGECLVGCDGISGNESYRLHYPQSVAFDNQGALYVSDTGNHRVQKFLLMPAVGK